MTRLFVIFCIVHLLRSSIPLEESRIESAEFYESANGHSALLSNNRWTAGKCICNSSCLLSYKMVKMLCNILYYLRVQNPHELYRDLIILLEKEKAAASSDASSGTAAALSVQIVNMVKTFTFSKASGPLQVGGYTA